MARDVSITRMRRVWWWCVLCCGCGAPLDLAPHWRPVAVPVSSATRLSSVWSGEREAWAVGDKGLIIHFSDEDGAIEPTPTRANLRAVVNDGTPFIVGESGATLWRQAGVWTDAGWGGVGFYAAF